MFSITGSLVRLLVSWNVRTMPRAAMRCGATPSIDLPSNVQSPASGLSKPVMRLKNVVLPAPLGPISAVIDPRCTSTRSTSTAVMPPKLRRTPSAVRIGSGFWTPGSGVTPASAARATRAVSDMPAAVAGSASIECHLLAVAEDALRAGRHQQHEQETHQHEHDRPDLGRVDARRTSPADGFAPDDLAQEAVEKCVQRPEQHRPDDRTGDLGDAAKHEAGQDVEGQVATEVVGLHVGGAERQDEPGERTDHTAEDERLHLV